ncbi:hypothetical protein P7228_11505 [Altererythrobacter arenosus]|uniref:Copper amine oxidase-like N-terminal domain-containing protein n=1 Tax=Altererythrobacter arenosus TaxID=3032592 RepID=A0ABY8FNM0_9SPHN|nr:hypothetical protein [Altererythrobacter sp. CAU 1644]WFL76619.1 hypothetical protein P7228_11505 [Altererythrobacter sp. CAU 1644]
MSTVPPSRSIRRIAENGFAHAPRLALIGALAFVLAMPVGLPTLAFIPKSAMGALSRIEEGSPLRLVLPEATVVQPASLAVDSAADTVAADRDGRETSQSASDFDSAFLSADFTGPISSTKPPSPIDLKPGRFLDLKYDISRLEPTAEKLDRNDGSLTVEKPLLVDGVSAGSAMIRIEEGAKIYISASSVARALGPKVNALPKRISGALAQGSGFIPFYELRGAGIAVEYDAARDRVAMSTPS